jgi:hypothetical protein
MRATLIVGANDSEDGMFLFIYDMLERYMIENVIGTVFVGLKKAQQMSHQNISTCPASSRLF